MKQALLALDLDIVMLPTLNHPLVQAYVHGDIEPTESHVECLCEAIKYAKELVYSKE